MSPKKHLKSKNPVGRPREILIDWNVFDGLCKIQCTLNEIAAFYDCNRDTITDRLKTDKGMTFTEYFAMKSGTGRISLRRKQFEKALSGNATMLIWLGKQYLGQAERSMLAQGEYDDEEFRNAFFGITSKEPAIKNE